MKKMIITMMMVAITTSVLGCGSGIKEESSVPTSSSISVESNETETTEEESTNNSEPETAKEEEIKYDTDAEDAKGDSKGLSFEQKINLKSLSESLYEAEKNDPTMKNYRTLEDITNDTMSTCDTYGYKYVCEYMNKEIKKHKDNTTSQQSTKQSSGSKTYEDKNNIDFYIVNTGFYIETKDFEKYRKYMSYNSYGELWDQLPENYKKECRKAFREEWKRETGSEFNPTTFNMSQDLFKSFTSQYK